jgi:cyclopropane fatty-acyl-phospholipid synthase-like methyltransferase
MPDHSHRAVAAGGEALRGQQPAMAERLYRDGEYLHLNLTWHSEDSSWKATQIMRMMTANNLMPSSVCEVGCGAGEVLHQLSLRMPEHVSFVGYEISPQAFAFCQTLHTKRVQFYLRSGLEDNAVYDITMAIDVMEHIEDYFGFLRRLKPLSRYHLFHIPLDLSAQSVLRGTPILRGRRTVGHLHYFTKDTALATLQDAGYRILDWFYTASCVDLPAESFASLMARWPRRILARWNQDFAVRLLGGYSMLVLTK